MAEQNNIINIYGTLVNQTESQTIAKAKQISMEGYSKGSDGSAITPSDTVTAAIAKLEKQVENTGSSGSSDIQDLREEFEAHKQTVNTDHKIKKNNIDDLKDDSDVKFKSVTATGNINAAGFFQSSDKRLKTSIDKIDLTKGDIDLIQFNWKESGKLGYGVIADDVEKNYPNIVSIGEDGFKRVNYIEALVIKLAQLEEKIKELEEKLNK